MLTVEERDNLLSKLDTEQRHFLNETMIRSRRTHFANVLARKKGAVIPENATFEEVESLLSEWIYVGYIDAGFVSEEHRCECGRPLRYQHIVEHKRKGDVLKFGINHLQEHVGIDDKTVKEIVSGFNKIDLELDEILNKILQGWSIDKYLMFEMEALILPLDIKQHLDLGLPLLDRQLARLRTLVSQQREKAMNREPEPPMTTAENETAAATGVRSLGYIQGDLFVNEPVAFPSSEPVKRNRDQLSKHQQEIVKGYLQQGIGSARIICEHLIMEHGAYDERYRTEKPMIFYAVCQSIEEWVRKGYCDILEKNQYDRKYRWLDISGRGRVST